VCASVLILVGAAAAALKSRVPAKGGPPAAHSRTDAGLDTLPPLEIVRTLADPRFEGRGAGTAGIGSAAAFLVREMERMALLPGGEDDTYYQSMEITTGVEVGEPCGVEAGGRRWNVGGDVQPLGFSTTGTLRAPIVFAGYGITAAGYEYDDYAGVDARDKLVLVLAQEPGEVDSTSRFDGSVNTPHTELRMKAITAREHGALGLLVVNGPRYHSGEPLRKPRTEGGGYMTSGLLAVQVSERVAEEPLGRSGLRLADLQLSIDRQQKPRSQALHESATVTVTLKRTRATVRNVDDGGIRPRWSVTGRDPSGRC